MPIKWQAMWRKGLQVLAVFQVVSSF